jgi:hypothetical protein
MSRNSISVWMYLCRAPRYLSTKCRSEYLIPYLVRKVWKIFVIFELTSCSHGMRDSREKIEKTPMGI